MSIVTCVEDLQAMARRRLPRLVSDYVESGSWTESTVRANLQALADVRLRQRVARNIEVRDTSAVLAGTPSRLPAAISPTGLSGLLHPQGEMAMARAAAAADIPYSLSIASSYSLEQVRQVTDGPLWMQLSVVKDEHFLHGLIERAREQRCAALILTLDFHVAAVRRSDLRNGFRLPMRPTWPLVKDLLTHPGWCWSMRRRPPVFGNIIGHARGVTDMASFGRWYQGQFELALGWHHVEAIKRRWQGPLIVKGILDPDDARQALDAGADAVSVSNQGGRQLDGAPGSAEVLPAVVDAVGKRMDVLLDGGIRTGQDIVKACALGARGVLLGRAPLYGLGACGEAGVRRVLALLREELDLTLALCGCPVARELGREHLWGATFPRAHEASMNLAPVAGKETA